MPFPELSKRNVLTGVDSGRIDQPLEPLALLEKCCISRNRYFLYQIHSFMITEMVVSRFHNSSINEIRRAARVVQSRSTRATRRMSPTKSKATFTLLHRNWDWNIDISRDLDIHFEEPNVPNAVNRCSRWNPNSDPDTTNRVKIGQILSNLVSSLHVSLYL